MRLASTSNGGRRWVLPIATRSARVSPAGDAVVWTDSRGLVVRRFDTAGDKLIPTLPPTDEPAWSPDGSHIAFAAGPNVYRTRLSDGETSLIGPRPGPTRGLTWSRNGTLVFAALIVVVGALYSVPIQGGHPEQLTVPGLTGGFFFQPEFLPDGETLLFAWSLPDDEEVGLYMASLKGGG
jgi:Tol biopolymer transport system component